jgi:hypothetical protein
MPLYPTYKYQGYQIGIRANNTITSTKEAQKGLAENWKYGLVFLFSGRKINLDLWVVTPKKCTNKEILTYEWKLCYPDGKQTNNVGGTGTFDLTNNKVAKQTLPLGHMSITGAYRIDLVMKNNINDEQLDETFDFSLHDFNKIEIGLFQAVILVVVTSFVTVFLKGCGMGV